MELSEGEKENKVILDELKNIFEESDKFRGENPDKKYLQLAHEILSCIDCINKGLLDDGGGSTIYDVEFKNYAIKLKQYTYNYIHCLIRDKEIGFSNPTLKQVFEEEDYFGWGYNFLFNIDDDETFVKARSDNIFNYFLLICLMAKLECKLISKREFKNTVKIFDKKIKNYKTLYMYNVYLYKIGKTTKEQKKLAKIKEKELCKKFNWLSFKYKKYNKCYDISAEVLKIAEKYESKKEINELWVEFWDKNKFKYFIFIGDGIYVPTISEPIIKKINRFYKWINKNQIICSIIGATIGTLIISIFASWLL